MSGLEAHHRAPDMSVTVRDGRYVIPVRREGVKGVGGIVHGTSGTGGTMFVEPPAAIEYGNRIRELEAEEQRRGRAHPRASSPIASVRIATDWPTSLDALAELDSLHARARYAIQYRLHAGRRWSPARDGFAIRDGRHPLLLAQGRATSCPSTSR